MQSVRQTETENPKILKYFSTETITQALYSEVTTNVQ